MDNNNTYIDILIGTLNRKNHILEEIIKLTMLQERYLNEPDMDMDFFDDTLEKKAELIRGLDDLDDGFEAIYERVSEELKTRKENYKDKILKLQELIKEVTDKGIRLEALEQQNKLKIETYFSSKKQEIKEFKKSNESVANYYKSMADNPQGESFFLDKKK